ncbi:putative vancomycin resistance protein [Desulfitobacterium dichloroeliminans LMG P-21439]|uniref:Putative vancomycin resistance protein n=1 Tax=Desulfitobacterium dichloroeliminans (strain LMG P-21439 / DCA1) TaxID=871963 RepID=L0FD40_DESDL|nr:VanW family protein [Desulfitobacterium dichloroeliminans]AGA70551.1 putative vancomycin resistance protein [Desulfitobacterium dichloroeliminans LMG P-21439]
MNTKKYVILALLFVGLSLATTLGINYLYYAQKDRPFTEGTSIAGVDIGKLTQEQAHEKITAELETWLAQPLKFQIDEKTAELPLKDLDPRVEVDALIAEAYAQSQPGSLFARIQKANATHDAPLDLGLHWDEQKLADTLKNSLASFEKAPVDASFTVNDRNQMDIQAEQMGQTVDTVALLTQIKEIQMLQELTPLKVDRVEVKPTVTAAELEAKKIDGLIASYTTWFDPGNIERSANVRLAAESLDGALIEPGGIISFNKIVGERTGDKGYQDALIIVNGEFVPGLGGGICQVSSTLYNAGVLANLKIEERTNHGLAVAYVPLGRDATVVYGAIDLKLKNDTDRYMLLRSKLSGGSVTIEFYGKATPGQEIIITNQVEQVIPFETQITQDNSLAPGTEIVKQNGQNGYVASASRIIKINGEVVETQALGRSTYISLAKIIVKGPALPAKPKPEPKPEPPAPEPETPTEPEEPQTPTEPESPADEPGEPNPGTESETEPDTNPEA